MSHPLLSILLPTTTDRRPMFDKLLAEIKRQIKEADYDYHVEIIIDEDEKQKSIGRKRQDLLEKASGTHISYIDSDDWIAPTYIRDIVYALITHQFVDSIGFYERVNINGKISKSIFSIRYKKWAENVDGYGHIRCANPKSVIRRTKALQVGYEDRRHGEDRIHSEAVTPLLETEHFIDKELYYYNYVTVKNEDRYGIKKYGNG